MNVFIIHGAYGNPKENWFPWLKKELKKLNVSTIIPQFPTPENQNIENWKKAFLPYEKELTEESIMIGHSIGPAFILNLLENKKIKQAIFVSGFLGSLNNENFDDLNKSFFKEFDFEKIKSNCKEFVLFHSDNDPYVPLEKGEELAKLLDTKLRIVRGAGHFNADAGYTEFQELLDFLK